MTIVLARYFWGAVAIGIVIAVIYYFAAVETPQKRVAQFLEALRNGDRAAAAECVGTEWRGNFSKEQSTDQSQEQILRVLKSMTYTLGAPTKGEECVLVPAELNFAATNFKIKVNIPVAREVIWWRVDMKKWERELSQALGFQNAEVFIRSYVYGKPLKRMPTGGGGGVISPWGPGGGIVTPGFGGLQ
ncbi:MAG: hypothetical protein RMK18_03215 [Armatimonadota bacterium]|nr:hypothetical protein [Armatimonadota bacterium]MCX7777070.1 hypothetical protein [Armatimonadota bacterium]MDW8024860.1 hypothetical protein [Armatimonadota bacterium]